MRYMSEVCGEIEKSCLLVCHFYLPREEVDIYIHSGSLAA
jgi:hypothetical protein